MGEYDKAFKQFVWVFKVTDVKNVLFPSTESGAFYKKRDGSCKLNAWQLVEDG